VHISSASNVESREVQVHFEQEGSELTAVEIQRRGRSPVIVSLHRALLALGIVVSTYQVKPSAQGLLERVVLQRRDGGAIQGQLSAKTRAAILPIAFHEGVTPA
jgi:hypothetical protein